ncbi:MAG: hypothetical protein EOQ86_30235 [Mesorhizobium sp.]|uniref:hypothetical protein n=1 Tax=Mesorhizobium sp. TaxID=1871066 RepID=UPI000FE6AC1F|nr:hypothetical protein [Mesorhizobium sp.]RWH69475.1 MAG: hypothetical protein EOQ85_32820 [Mesorhizobium sp.]RWH76341.1 MAG: hypothetical protein EOQ86_30235 [Mesorhizobium sp.]RWH83529.1 MAG: hypothetical protein EOQ87_32765 [Mesorhizobium sp.]RWH91546.1 MAG: hypothetical protein EOQ88_31780 [Mesorhizobium sp.]RWH95818.1 MAG: hypothetical protein EOQ89_30435 [Mesorhizobium sp.]
MRGFYRRLVKLSGLVAAFLAATATIASATADSDLLPYGSKAEMFLTITGRSGIDSDHAEVTVRHTRENAKAFCAQHGDGSEACIDKTLADVKVQDSILANCSTGKFTSVSGKGFNFRGRAAETNYPYAVQPDVPGANFYADYDVAIAGFRALCPAKVAQADREDPVPPAADYYPLDADKQSASDVAEGNGEAVSLAGSSFRGVQLGMSEQQIAQALDPSFVLKDEIPAPEILGGRTDGGPNVLQAPSGTLFIVRGEQQCGTVTFRGGQADRLVLYQCYFDIAGGMSIQDFAQQVIDAYGLEDGMAGSSQTRGDGAYQFEHIEYAGVKQATSERFTASSNGLSNSLTLTIERVPHAKFN